MILFPTRLCSFHTPALIFDFNGFPGGLIQQSDLVLVWRVSGRGPFWLQVFAWDTRGFGRALSLGRTLPLMILLAFTQSST
jgi:hypothetical protein